MTWIVFGKCMSALSLKYRQPRRSVCGRGIYTCGSSMHYSRSWRQRQVHNHIITKLFPQYHGVYVLTVHFNTLEQDYERARQVYKGCIQLIPHKKFTFAKIWLLYAKFEIRQLDLSAARKTLGMALGMCPKDRLFKGYIELELEVCPTQPPCLVD